MNICVFCSAKELDEKYTSAARELGRLIGSRGHTLVWGGSNAGTMKTIADGAEEAGGDIVGVSVEHFKQVARDAAVMHVTKGLAERKALMFELSDAFVVLPGGFGTLDEVTEMVEMRKYAKHTKPIVMLNIAGFYQGLRIQLEKMQNEGFLYEPLDAVVSFIDEPADAVAYLEKKIVVSPSITVAV